MSEQLLSKEQISAGYERYLAQHPDANARVNSITQDLADALGVDLTELRRIEAANALSESAASLDIDGFEFLLRFAVDSESDRQQIIVKRREFMERALGLK